MQNAPAMLAQKMMNRQAAYAPVGMVSQNMSGNKKGGASGPSGPVIGLKFDTTTSSAGITFSNSDTTAINSTGGATASVKGNASTTTGGTSSWYWEFTINAILLNLIGFGSSSFVCNTTNTIGFFANTVGYYVQNGSFYINSTSVTNIGAALVGDVIGFKLDLTATTATLTILKNNVVILNNFNITTFNSAFNSATAWFPIWTSQANGSSYTISNNIYSYAGYTPIGTAATTIAASASVPAVADGKYDVYTFNASGTFTAGSTGAVRALVIAGGGSGNGTGGGGAGGYQEKGFVATPQTYAITIGGGGDVSTTAKGSNSSIAALLVSSGGGAGIGPLTSSNGGSGGGASPSFVASGAFSAGGGAGVVGLGNNGGSSSGTTAAGLGQAGGGGGGAGAVGGNGFTPSAGLGNGGSGGAGLASNITGTSVIRAGGGGAYGDNIHGTGGSGGGGSPSGTISIASGAVNTGSGGAGAFGTGSGGSGVVIIRVRARA